MDCCVNRNDVIQYINDNLIRVDGKLNSPALRSNKHSDALNNLINLTSYLPSQATISERWYHMKHDLYSVPNCVECGKPVSWSDGVYKRFCSQLCAVTSEEARQRTHRQFIGKKQSQNQIDKSAATRTGTKRTDETKQKLRMQKLGSNNPMFGKKPWNFGIDPKDNPLFGRPRRNFGLYGSANPMFGKSPSPFAGKGINGKFKGLHFRSSLELCYLMYWYEENVVVDSAESNGFKVHYLDSDTIKTYSPDFFLCETSTIVEIKPKKLQSGIVLKKFDALVSAFPDMNCVMLSGHDIIDFVEHCIYNNLVDHYISCDMLYMTNKQLSRLRNNYGEIIRSINS